jgi:hypothetical protein
MRCLGKNHRDKCKGGDKHHKRKVEVEIWTYWIIYWRSIEYAILNDVWIVMEYISIHCE